MAQQHPVSASPRVIDESVVSVGPEGPVLLGTACASCSTVTFPAQRRCPRCSRTEMAATELPVRGTLWAFTVQRFAPKPPFRHSGDFIPFGLGYVDLGEVIVETRLTVADVERLHLGQAMRLTLVPAYDEDGVSVHTYAFEPEEVS